VVSFPSASLRSPLLLTTDAVVAGIHVDLSIVTLDDVGWKALTVAVSDIAAMGGTPGHAVVTLCAPPGTDVDEIARGVQAAAECWRCPVVGGDLSAATELVVSVAVTGYLEGDRPPVLRSTARPGDGLYVTGPLGRSAAGLRLLRGGSQASATAEHTLRSLEDAYRRPRARLAEGRAARESGATAMMDLSDGLGLDLHRLARASSVGVVLDGVPVAEGATEAEALGGGEDYELLIAAPEEAGLGDRFAAVGLRDPVRIGTCSADPEERRIGNDPFAPSGYQHQL